MSITAIIIAKNEEERIEKCLKSLSFCDEIVVVDNGSEDKTSDIAKNLPAGRQDNKAKIVEADSRDFSKLRNLGLQKAKGDWVLYVDADEIADSALAENIKSQIITNFKLTNIAAFKIKRKNFYLGNNEWPGAEHLERLFDRKKLKGWKGELHESPIIEGEIGELDGFLLHYTHRNLSEMVKKTIEWSKVEAELRYKAHHPKMSLWRFPRVMISEFFNWYITKGGWRAGTVGLIESMYQSFSIFITYARLWEMQNKK